MLTFQKGEVFLISIGWKIDCWHKLMLAARLTKGTQPSQ